MTAVDLYDEPRPGADYVVQIKIKNGPLLRAIRARGFKSAAEFGRAAGVSTTVVCKFLALQRPPLTKTGRWAPSIELMAKFLRLPPDCLFPEQHLDKALKRSSGEFEMTRDDAQLWLAPDDDDPEKHLLREEMATCLTKALQLLQPRCESVLRRRFGIGVEEQTLDEVAEAECVSRERIRQIEAKGLRQLKHPSRARLLSTGLEFEPHNNRHSLKPRHYADRLRFEHDFDALGLSVAERALLRAFGDGCYHEYSMNKGMAASALVKKKLARIIISADVGYFVITEAGRQALQLEKQF